VTYTCEILGPLSGAGGEPSLLGYDVATLYEGWNFNSGNYLFTTDTK